ncbi:MAG: methyl-accepting chemotaxis protein [Pseudomonadota bacterium]
MLTIKHKLIGMTLFGLIIGSIVSIFSYRSIQNINTEVTDSATIIHFHMTANMMHDAIHADVLGALLSAETFDKNFPSNNFEKLKKHSELFASAMNKNDKLITAKKTHDALDKILPSIRNYVAAATNLLQMAKNDRLAALQNLDDFEKNFISLETELNALTQLIDDDIALIQKSATAAKNKAAQILMFISVLGAAAMVIISLSVIKNITGSLDKLVHISERVASGDLSVRIDTSKTDEMGHLAQAMETMRVNLTLVISQISKTTTKVFTSVEEISAVTSETTANMQQQRAETEQVATAMNEMTATVHEVANNILSTSTSATKASSETNVSSEIVGQAIQAIKLLANQIGDASEIINQFESNSHNISSVLDVIKGIAEQTNLLALNAAIEAARAGEQGRGFAVVADEVRTLASRTQKSTGEINEMIGQLQAGSKSSVAAMNKSRDQAVLAVSQAEKAGQSLTTIAVTVAHITDLSAQIATAAEEQTAVSEEINRNITHINEAAIYTAVGSHKTAEAINDLAKMTAELQNLVQQFKV